VVGSAVAGVLPNPIAFLAVWAAGGLLVLFGAMTFAELGDRFPTTGGQYAFLKGTYGPAVAFTFGWASLFVYQTGGIAAVAIAFSHSVLNVLQSLGVPVSSGYSWHLGRLVTVAISPNSVLAVIVVMGLTITHFAGLRTSARLQVSVEAAVVIGILAFSTLGAVTGRASIPIRSWFSVDTGHASARWATAFALVWWAYDGWDRGAWLTGELERPRRDLPRVMIVGSALVIGLYLAVQITLLCTLQYRELAASSDAAQRAADRLIGAVGPLAISLLISVSCLGCLSTGIMTGPYVYRQIARDGLLPKIFSRTARDGRTPQMALLLQGLWCCVLLVSGSYISLVIYATTAALVFQVLSACALFVARSRRAQAKLFGYRVPVYPFVPVLFMGSCLYMLVALMTESPRESLFCLFIVAVGIGTYVIRQRFGKQARDLTR